MKITHFDVDGYGVWSGLRVERLSDATNVFYGPNEAGKTTLLQFIRAVLYGFSPERRRYLPPVHGGRSGGDIDVDGLHGSFRISRHLADDASEQLLLTAPDGTRQGEHFVKVLLSNVDETVFNNVFAVGLREIQELATLGDTEAAQQLYSLSAGLDRVSLVEVLRELEASRNRILDAGGGKCQVSQLLERHEKLRAEIEELSEINHRHGRLAVEREQAHGDIARLEEEANGVERMADVADLAAVVRERWAERAAIDEQLSALGPPRVMPEGAVERLDAINAGMAKHEQRIEELTRQRDELKREFAALRVNDALWRQAARIEALGEQTPWIAELRERIGQCETEIAGVASELAAEAARLGVVADPAAADAADVLPALSSQGLSSLRSPGKALRQNRRRLTEAKQAAASAADAAEKLSGQLEAALSSRGQSDLATAMDRAGNLVSQLRRRMQMDDRLDQLARHESELESQRRAASQTPSFLPARALVGLGATLAVGAALILVGLLTSFSFLGAIGWVLAVIGFVGGGMAAGGKVLVERANAQRVEACQRQLGVLRSQIEQTKGERDSLDAQLPSGMGATAGSGVPATRLQAAERDLVALEELAPVETRRNAARQEAEAAARRETEARQQYKAAQRRWRESLSAAGLPDGLGPVEAKRLLGRIDVVADMQRRLAARREERDRYRREFDSLAERITKLAAEVGVVSPETDPTALLQSLAEAVERQQASVERRDAIRQEARRVRIAVSKREEAIGRLRHRRRQLFAEAGVKEEQELRQRAIECARADMLRQRRESLDHEIDAALGSQCTEEAIRQQLDAYAPAVLESRRAELRQRFLAVQERLRGLLEQQGRLNEQLDAIAADRQLPTKYLELAMLEKRIEDAIRRWQVLAAACSILVAIRDDYERNRQPETLQEASGYLDRLTQGRYRRVWTPLGEHALRVDDAEGHSLGVEALSRGTREQLFLSLRLALASSYARRGSPLPLVLDDVLVNFDDERAKAAAAVLRDFAAAGHQLLIFTCHEHIFKLFKSLRVPAGRLPINSEPGQALSLVESRAAEERPKRERRAAPRRKTAAKEDVPAAENDEIDEESAESVDEDESLWEEDDSEADGFGSDDIAAA